MPRKPKPDLAPYLRLILGIPINKKILPTEDQTRLDLATAIVTFVTGSIPRKDRMSTFLKDYAETNTLSKSYCYKIKARLEELKIIKFDNYWQEYRLNIERWKRDLKALRQFKAKVDKLNKSDDLSL